MRVSRGGAEDQQLSHKNKVSYRKECVWKEWEARVWKKGEATESRDFSMSVRYCPLSLKSPE